MLLSPTLDAIHSAAVFPSAVVDVQYHQPEFNTSFRLSRGLIVETQSAVLPTWSTSLRALGLHPSSIAQAKLQSSSGAELLQRLLSSGAMGTPDVMAVVQERILSALMPVLWRNGAASVREAESLPSDSQPGMSVTTALQQAERHMESLGALELSMRFSDRFLASPTNERLGSEADPLEQLYSAALHGLSLGDIAKRLPQRWDLLTRNVALLLDQDVLRPEHGLRRREVAPQLAAGDKAPDFCLPDYHGGEVRLSQLRGQPVWLVFNRQSTCALCNPHNAQIITMHDRLRVQGVQIVSVWGSSLQDLKHGIGSLKPPYPVLADPRDETYDRYGLTHSLSGFLDMRNLPTAVAGLQMMGVKALKDDGELIRMPAEFLINPDGVVEVAHYNSYGTDWLPMEQVIDWASRHERSVQTNTGDWDEL